jgi:hypothetical protein
MEDEFLGSHPQKVSLEPKHISKYLPKVKKKVAPSPQDMD